ncbi:hypothetical protein RCH18_002517 [Flavobacterium sp. PL11]|uniref:head GIN domain-containing protein n=1 Tax=Flavobacterium sp. PL11 TaxID=3071717 RepID=UPI002E0CF7AB|nr:hypothetical protein [Flavobacterium sp. PL11]
MKKSIQFLVSCALLVTTLAQAQWFSNQKIKGNGNFISEQRVTKSYEKIDVTGFFDVELVAGKEGTITVKGEENLVPLIKIEVVNQVLKIFTEKNKYISTSKGKGIVIVIPIENINNVSLTGSGDIVGKTTIKSENFSVQLTGSGDIDLKIEANSVNVLLTGSGDINLSGNTESINSDLKGSGDIDAGKLTSKNANVTVSGSGDNAVNCTETIYARVTGSGEIKYTGNPNKKDTKVSGSGSIKRS